MGEIIQRKGLTGNLVHGGGGIGHGCHLVCIVFLPPVQWSSKIDRNKYLTDEFAVIAACTCQALCQIQIVWTHNEIPLLIIKAIHTIPAVHRITGTTNGIFKIHYTCSFNGNHVNILISFQSILSYFVTCGQRKTKKLRTAAIPAGNLRVHAYFEFLRHT